MKKLFATIGLWFAGLLGYLIGSSFLVAGSSLSGNPDIPATYVQVLTMAFGIFGLIYLTALSYLHWNRVYNKLAIRIELPKPWMSTIFFPLGLFALLLIAQLLLPIPPSDNQQAVVNGILAQPFFSFFAVVIFAPIMEELLFRGLFAGYFFPNLTKKTSLITYFILTSSLFCLAHGPRTLPHILIYFTMGAALGWLYLAKRDLRYSMGLHAANNLLSFVLIFL
ncbi:MULTISPECIES: CPBP family intramembrane glutamic endopeptidase [unclassified Streptococcus]|uniref:CPBP family intramembrane glutamic endopeptidase n=1 Tax=unclassified Streptococcus TaxID=2608887 RepID=UPI001071E382|nr:MULTISPECIES: type II CAAX endopeptidase family protein [unclassified Streptococcus]MBF0787479.1 CPBP family intramembrane metalloprotease [Streptococcus sp. 19428wC2_LYSM12]MCQ9212039.1 CPBP family intramembrane metalloprotease [Streptococcus sp. B01]MCQ9213368.1 CPBP family intramembrane metalloprotease [Streptococcus sp. O1]TFV05562.1 CPBP family intramembrane metalloprotease [Streptococcus sp. LYSM12]